MLRIECFGHIWHSDQKASKNLDSTALEMEHRRCRFSMSGTRAGLPDGQNVWIEVWWKAPPVRWYPEALSRDMITPESGGEEEVRVWVRAPAAVSEIGCNCEVQINDSPDASVLLSQQRRQGRMITLQTSLFPALMNVSAVEVPHIIRPGRFVKWHLIWTVLICMFIAFMARRKYPTVQFWK